MRWRDVPRNPFVKVALALLGALIVADCQRTLGRGGLYDFEATAMKVWTVIGCLLMALSLYLTVRDYRRE
jgi:hypothetical protein